MTLKSLEVLRPMKIILSSSYVDLNCLSEWSLKWKLKFNVSKCNILHLGTTKQYPYFLCGTPIQPAQSIRDLGVMIDQDLKFHEHTSLVTNRPNRVLGLIKRGFTYLDSDMLVRLYKSMVHPILEYGNIIMGTSLPNGSEES